MQNIAIFIIGIITFANSLLISDILEKQNEKVELYGEYTTPAMRQAIIIKGDDFKICSIPLDENLQKFTYALCKAYNIDYSFVLAIMEQESGFNVNAAHAGNYGLMQINAINAEMLEKNLGIKDLKDPYNNIRAGIFMLHTLFERYYDKEKVLMAYNLGEGGAKILWDKGVFETKYVNSVLARQGKYQRLDK